MHNAQSLVIDNDMLGAVLRTVRGIEVSDDTLSVEVIKDTVHGEGHYLRHPQTLEVMRTEFAYPQLVDRRAPGEWDNASALDIREQAAARVRSIRRTSIPASTGGSASVSRSRCRSMRCVPAMGGGEPGPALLAYDRGAIVTRIRIES